MTDPIFCPICGIKQENGVFYWSNPSANMTADKDAVFSRICNYVTENRRKEQGCLNTEGQFNKDLTYKEPGV